MELATRKFLVGIALCISAVACSPRAPHPKSLQAQGIKVGRVNVELIPDTLGARREEVFGNVKGVEQLRDAVTTRLTQSSLLDPSSGFNLNIKVTSFRMRNGATRFFTGVMSGSDHLEGDLSVSRGSELLLQMPIEASGGNGNPFNISSKSRSAGLIDSFAELVVIALKTEALSAHPVIMSETPQAAKRPATEMAKKKPLPAAAPAAPDSCSVEQVLSLKKAGLSDSQVRAACK